MKERVKKLLRRRWFWGILVFIGFVLVLYFFRFPILRQVYYHLNVGIYPRQTYDYAIILGVEPLDRPADAAMLYHKGKVLKLICTGSQVPRPLQAIGITQTEAEMSKSRLLSLQVPEKDILLLPKATSTREEADALDVLFKGKPKGKLLIITTETHTRRALGTFKEYCDPWEEMDVYGVSPTTYHGKMWWENEFGFLAVFEEYLKLVYYWVKY